MQFEHVDIPREPQTDEFEKLEFLPEEPRFEAESSDDTAEIVFSPAEDVIDEPPISFRSDVDLESLEASEDDDPGDDRIDPNFGTGIPFELVGTSLIDDLDFDDEPAPLDFDSFDDDIDF